MVLRGEHRRRHERADEPRQLRQAEGIDREGAEYPEPSSRTFPAKQAKDPKAKAPKPPRGAEKIVDVLQGKVVLWVTLRGGGFNPFRSMMGGGGGSANDVEAIRQALDISQLLGQGVVLQKPLSAWLVPDEIAATGSMVVLSPRDRTAADPKDPERTGSNLASAAILAKAGVPVAVTCPRGRFGGGGVGTGGILGQDLNTPHVDAAYAVRGGLDNRKALRTLTLDAARMLGVEARIGSLEVGKDADVLILDGDPLHYTTFVETALVNGKVVYEKDEESPLPPHQAVDRFTARAGCDAVSPTAKASRASLMSVESLKELDDFFRSMRQSFNSRDLKTYRSHFWTDKRFQNLDASGRRDRGWGAFEEVLDQEFRYLDSVKLELKDMEFQVFDDQFAHRDRRLEADPDRPRGPPHEQNGRCTFSRVPHERRLEDRRAALLADDGRRGGGRVARSRTVHRGDPEADRHAADVEAA